ncbi:MAG: hypothetical protein AAB647_01650 [Patescibacteria group bacterium]
MNFSAPSWDLFIVLFLIIAVGYGLLMQRERIIVTMVAAYIGLVISSLLWSDVFGFFQGTHPLLGRYFIRANVTESQIQIGLFAISMFLVSHKAGIDAEKGRGWLSGIELFILSALTGLLIAAIILGYVPEAAKVTLAEQSKLIGYLVHYYNLAILTPIAVVVLLGIKNGRSRD